jgi:manganese/iron transport system permease protein
MLGASVIFSLSATAALAVACAVLSVFVVARRWAFIGEGISHSGFGGAGLAWMIMLAVPALAEQPWLLPTAIVVFCLATAIAIGYLSHGNRVTGDAAIGIFLVASLAFGFLAQHFFKHVHHGKDPPAFGEVLLGHTAQMSSHMALAAVLISAAVVIIVAALSKEILAYCFDPLMAQASGVRVGFIHYLLMVLIALTIVIGIPITGSLLVTALLVLPGVIANLLDRRLNVVIILAIGAALVSAIAGVWLNATWPFIPTGPAIVLTLFVQFLVVYIVTRTTRSASASG